MKRKSVILTAIRPSGPPYQLIAGQFSPGIEPTISQRYFIRKPKDETSKK